MSTPERPTHHSQSVEWRQGAIVIDESDLGPGVEAFWGRGSREYEWVATIRREHVDDLCALVGASRSNVVTFIRQRLHHERSSQFVRWLQQNGVPVDVWSRVGD